MKKMMRFFRDLVDTITEPRWEKGCTCFWGKNGLATFASRDCPKHEPDENYFPRRRRA